MMMDKNSDNIQVMVRVRPFNGRERAEDARSCVILDDSRPNCIILDAKPDQKAFNFDWVGGDRTTQQDIFEVVGKAMVHTCLEGYNCCIFAYGQTGAGKTFTMQGRGFEINDEDILNRGLQPRVFDYIFALKAKDMNENPDMKYLVTCSYLEIYNEQIMDLLEPVAGNLQIREDLKKGVYVEGLKEEMVENSEETIELLRKGAINRHVGSTNMNAESSRSHSLFTMSIERKVVTNGTIHVRTSKFHFVDLAGSERQQKTAAVGERLKEAGNINKSLSVLGQVINSLVEIAEGKQRHIRYRDSKLTFILKDSLGGNSKTSLIANISPASSSFSETLSTLKFAQRAKQIKNKASINEDLTGSVEGLKNEIRQLKEELSRYKSNMMAIENTERRTLTPPRITSHSHFGFSLENQRTFLEQNQRFIEVEILLKQSLEVLSENELALQTELAKKEEYINMFRNAVDFYQCNELQYRTVLSLNHVRIERLSKNLTFKVEEIDMNNHYHEEVDHLQRELQYIFEIVKNTPAVMRVYMENVEMREKLDSLEAEMNPTSTVSIARQLQENLILVHQLNQKLEEDINDRKFLMERLERIEGFRDGMTSPEKFKRSEEDVRKLKLEHSQHIEQLHQEILNLKQRENEAHRILELENKKNSELLRENTFLKDENEKMEERYGKRYNELFKEVEQIHEIRSDPNTLESRLDQLNIKNFELKDQMLSYKDKNEKIMKLYQELEDHLQTTLKEKDENETSLREELERAVSEKNILESSVGTLESRMKMITEDLDKFEKENNELTETLADFYLKENDYKINLQERVNNLEDVKNAEIRQLETIVEKQKVCLETLENDRSKVQEELDTLTQTLNYNVNQLEEKTQHLVELQEKLSEKEKMFEEVQGEFNRQKEYTESLEKQINDENSPYNLAIKESVRLHEEIKETVSHVKALEEELQGKKDELEQACFKINGLTESTQHYSSAYKDTFEKLEVKANEAKEIQAALDSKLAELAQLEQELKASNENTLNKENEVNELKANIERINENIQGLEKKNMELDAEVQEKKNENEQLTAQGEDLQNKIIGLEQQIEQMKLSHFNELEQLANSLMASEETSNKKSLEIQALEEKIQEAYKSIEDLRVQNGQMEEENQELKSSFQKMKEEVECQFQKLNDIIAESTEANRLLEEEKVKALEEIDLQRGEVIKRDENIRVLEEEKVQALNEIEVQKGEVVKRDENIRILEDEKMKALEEIEIQKGEISKRDEDLRVLGEEKTQALAEIEVQKGEVVKRDENIRILEDEKMKALEEIDTQKGEIVKRDENIRILEEEKVQALNEIEVQKGEIMKRDEDLRVLGEEKTQALAEIEVQKGEVVKRDESIRILEEEKVKALNEIEIQKGELNQRDESLRGLEEEKLKAYDEINLQKGELAQRDELLKENDMMLLESTKRIEELQNKLTEVQEEVEKFKSSQEQALNKISELEQELVRREELQRSAEKMIEENNMRIEELQNGRAKLEEEVEQFKKEVAEGLNKISELNNEITNQQGLLNLKEENIQENVKQIEGLENQISQTQQILDQKVSMLQETEQRLSEKVEKISNQVDIIRNLESQITEKNVQLETLEKNLFVAEEAIRDVKNKLEESGSKVADLEAKLVDKQEEMNRKIEELKSENQRELESKANEYSMEIETSRKQTAEVQSELDDLKASIQSDYVTLKEYNQTVGEMQSVLDEERNNVTVQLNTIREEIERDAKDKEELIEKFELKEKELEDKVASLVQETTRFSEEVAESKKKIEELQEKNESLEKDNEKKANEIQECLDGMSQMKEQIESYGPILKQLEEFTNVKQENSELRLSQKKQEEMINYLQKAFAEYYRNQEVEMSRIKESYNKLQEECDYIKANIEAKEGEILKSNENTRLALQEKENLLVEIKRLKDHEGFYKKAKEEVEEKMNALNNEKAAIMTQLTELEKVNSQLAGHNNLNQKRQYMNDLKDEIKKHVTEKTTLQSNLNKSLAKTGQLQKQLDEFAKKHHIDASKLGTDLREDPDILLELNKLKIENHNLKDVVFRVNSLLTEGFIHLKSLPQPYNNSKDDFNVTLEHVRELVKLIKNKEKARAEKEKEMNDTRHFDIQLIDKHLEDIRQNYSVTLNDPEFKAVLQQHAPIVHTEHKRNIENKENNNEIVVQKPKTKEMNMSKVLAPRPVSGVKRNLDTMISSSANKGSSFVDRFGRKPASDISRARKESTDKAKARPSYEKPGSKQKSFLKQNNSIGDITNQELDREGVTKKLKQDTVLHNNTYLGHSQIANK